MAYTNDTPVGLVPLLVRFGQDDISDSKRAMLIREDVVNNIRFILQATQLTDILREDDASGQYNKVSQSVINFGIPPFAGSVSGSISAKVFCKAIHLALITHETRLDNSSVEVTIDGRPVNRSQLLSGEFEFKINARIQSLPEGISEFKFNTVMHPFRVPEVSVEQFD